MAEEEIGDFPLPYKVGTFIGLTRHRICYDLKSFQTQDRHKRTWSGDMHMAEDSYHLSSSSVTPEQLRSRPRGRREESGGQHDRDGGDEGGDGEDDSADGGGGSGYDGGDGGHGGGHDGGMGGGSGGGEGGGGGGAGGSLNGDCYGYGGGGDDGYSGGGLGGDGGGGDGDYFVSSDMAMHENQTYISPGDLLSNLLSNEGLDAEFRGSRILDDISMLMQENDLERRRSQVARPQKPLDVDLNDPPSGPLDDTFALGGTPSSAFAADPSAHPGPSMSPQRTPNKMEHDGDRDEDEISLA
ncbi:aspartate, glycine, lysine and serine-rich protein-like [Arachis ipaensis]|uniref:aspartate, glycine, lysine and serine-rich protein-like n=1 Tax=Arachis ipaensis TaxID=130454 RepID=UPI000A2B0D66|nr:aspartate, glycine, lysine and serine-rich protein-like [Arachis ipaensis]XP_025651856.1 aspartate, glycine, lysine and serine-rich protein-like [Arachis hypogaea]